MIRRELITHVCLGPPTDTDQTHLRDLSSHVTEQLPLRRSSRISKQPERLNL